MTGGRARLLCVRSWTRSRRTWLSSPHACSGRTWRTNRCPLSRPPAARRTCPRPDRPRAHLDSTRRCRPPHLCLCLTRTCSRRRRASRTTRITLKRRIQSLMISHNKPPGPPSRTTRAPSGPQPPLPRGSSIFHPSSPSMACLRRCPSDSWGRAAAPAARPPCTPPPPPKASLGSAIWRRTIRRRPRPLPRLHAEYWAEEQFELTAHPTVARSVWTAPVASPGDSWPVGAWSGRQAHLEELLGVANRDPCAGAAPDSGRVTAQELERVDVFRPAHEYDGDEQQPVLDGLDAGCGRRRVTEGDEPDDADEREEHQEFVAEEPKEESISIPHGRGCRWSR
ncbi:hypothetical protein K438DRAFT_125040 [Mycena galopus ATCC 62051]|nr:hypothetical protein K438DRAFT_125040 [Mycena galopus ATCC 62051]